MASGTRFFDETKASPAIGSSVALRKHMDQLVTCVTGVVSQLTDYVAVRETGSDKHHPTV